MVPQVQDNALQGCLQSEKITSSDFCTFALDDHNEEVRKVSPHPALLQYVLEANVKDQTACFTADCLLDWDPYNVSIGEIK